MLRKALFFATLLVPALSSAAVAQDLSADEVLTKLEERSTSLTDAYFLLTGTVFDADTQEYALEVDVQFIPGEELARADIYQPDALADNFIIADGNTVYNYLFVTNQVTILNADDPQALGDLLPEGQGAVNLTPTWAGFSSRTIGSRQSRVTRIRTLVPFTASASIISMRPPTSIM